MKKEKLYSALYGMVLLFTLLATSAIGQYAYTSNLDSAYDFDVEVTKKRKVVKVNAVAVETISKHIKSELTKIKNRFGLSHKGTWLAEVVVGQDGSILSASVSEDDEIGNLIENIVLNLQKVEPITYNGIAKEKTIQIPIVVGKN